MSIQSQTHTFLFKTEIKRLGFLNEEQWAEVIKDSGKAEECRPVSAKQFTREIEENFPVKNRERNRKHWHGKERKKRKDRSRKQVAMQRGYNLYLSGMDTNGNTHRARFLKDRTESEMRDFLNKNTTIKEKPIPWKDWFSSNQMYPADIIDALEGYRNDEDTVMETVSNLYKNGIEIYSDELDEFCNIYFAEKSKRERKFQIDSERETVGYEVWCPSYPNDSELYGVFKTETEAENLVDLLEKANPEYAGLYNITPVKAYSDEQVKEIIELGFYPIPFHPFQCCKIGK